MIILLMALAVSYGLEALLFWRYWNARRYAVPVISFIGVFAAGGMSFWHLNLISLSIGLVAVYRFINELMMVDGRGHEEYLRKRTVRSTKYCAAVHAVLVMIWVASLQWHAADILQVAAISGAVIAALLGVLSLASVLQSRIVTRYKKTEAAAKTKDLPSVSLAIPARNETEVLGRTLQAAIASDYPKLEILVLDDCSQDATAEIIKGFAHDGVRFVQGGPVPDEHWVHKNYACQQLLEHASGKLVLFAGVDVAFDPDTISRMVAHYTSQKLGMLAVLPGRAPKTGSSLPQTIRYWWELALPRNALRRPPVLSSCWLADTKQLKKIGGFEAVSRMVVPEAFFAREFGKKHAYALVRGNQGLGVTSRKAIADQYDTAVRVRYPQVRRRPELVMALAFVWLAVWIVPLAGFLMTEGLSLTVLYVAAVGWVTFAASFVLISSFYAPHTTPVTALVSPLLPLVDLVLLHVSLYRYEFGTIEWKGRNVCLPVMHVYKSLPKMAEDKMT